MVLNTVSTYFKTVQIKFFLTNSPSVSQYVHIAQTNMRQAAGWVFYSRSIQPFIWCGNFVKIWSECGEHEIKQKNEVYV